VVHEIVESLVDPVGTLTEYLSCAAYCGRRSAYAPKGSGTLNPMESTAPATGHESSVGGWKRMLYQQSTMMLYDLVDLPHGVFWSPSEYPSFRRRRCVEWLGGCQPG